MILIGRLVVSSQLCCNDFLVQGNLAHFFQELDIWWDFGEKDQNKGIVCDQVLLDQFDVLEVDGDDLELELGGA